MKLRGPLQKRQNVNVFFTNLHLLDQNEERPEQKANVVVCPHWVMVRRDFKPSLFLNVPL